MFSVVFEKTLLFKRLKKAFSDSFFPAVLSLVFIISKRLIQELCSKQITQCTFLLNFRSCLNDWFTFLMCTLHVILNSKLGSSFFTFPILILSAKNGSLLWLLCSSTRHLHWPLKYTLSCLFLIISSRSKTFTFSHTNLCVSSYWRYVVFTSELFWSFIYLLLSLA